MTKSCFISSSLPLFNNNVWCSSDTVRINRVLVTLRSERVKIEMENSTW